MGKQTKVILTQDVPNLGQFGDEKLVKLGYASNFLIPNALAQRVTQANKAIIQSIKDRKQAYINQKRKEASALKQKLDNQAIKLAVAVNDNGDLYGSINRIMIADAVQDQLGVHVQRESINKAFSIDTIGDHAVRLDLFDSIQATLIVRVAAES